jgi:hypothetical protein
LAPLVAAFEGGAFRVEDFFEEMLPEGGLCTGFAEDAGCWAGCCSCGKFDKSVDDISAEHGRVPYKLQSIAAANTHTTLETNRTTFNFF